MLWITVHSCIPSLFPLCLLMNNTFELSSFLFLQFHLNTLYFITEVDYNPASSDGHITATASYYSSVVMYCYLLPEIKKKMFFFMYFLKYIIGHYWTVLKIKSKVSLKHGGFSYLRYSQYFKHRSKSVMVFKMYCWAQIYPRKHIDVSIWLIFYSTILQCTIWIKTCRNTWSQCFWLTIQINKI